MTKRYYVTGNFSKYVPTGSVRVDAACDDSELPRLLAFKYDGGCASYSDKQHWVKKS